MSYVLYIAPKARKSLDSVRKKHRGRFLKVFDDLVTDPFSGKPLEGRLKGQYVVRVWPYRILYRLEERMLIIIILDITHRQGAYKKR